MDIKILDSQPSVLNTFLAQLRDVEVQKDSMRFRRNIERVGGIMAYEVSRSLSYAAADVRTPLGVATVELPSRPLVVGTILRAGLPMHQGVLNVFDNAENCFVSAYRTHGATGGVDVRLEYVATPPLGGKTLLLCDPMLATGQSLVATYRALKLYGTPAHTHLMCVIGARQGLDYVKNELQGEAVSLWLATLDQELDERKYIVPGLGDAGDLEYGEKMSDCL